MVRMRSVVHPCSEFKEVSFQDAVVHVDAFGTVEAKVARRPARRQLSIALNVLPAVSSQLSRRRIGRTR
jgi:hypothetical protein